MILDLIKLTSTTGSPTSIDSGEIINGYSNVMWVERYSEPGEFIITAPLSSGLMEMLPLDSLISHLNTTEIMMVENHEIEQEEDEDPKLIITGRSFLAFLEHRVLGDNYASTPNYDIPEYLMASATTAQHITLLIRDHLDITTHATYSLPDFAVVNVASGTLTTEERTLEYETLDQVVQKLLAIDDLGIRSYRPSGVNPNCGFIVHNGTNKTETVRFSWRNGDLKSLKYFSTIKNKKTYVRTMGRWIQEIYEEPGDGYFRRGMTLDASDVDQQHQTMPTSTALLWGRIVMDIRAKAAIAANNGMSIIQADASPDSNLAFRRDYKIGDLVTVEGDFGVSNIMRVTEYAETDDEKDGYSGHPTLSIPGGE